MNGICAGGAFHWVADADIVIAASDAQFFDPHVSIGQVVAIEAIGLMRKMPAEAVMRMALVGRHERMSAQRAYELGMISEVVDPPERLREAAQELAEKIAQNSPAAMAATKRALLGCARAWASPTPAGPAPPSSCRCGATPTRRRAPRLRREAGRRVDGVSRVTARRPPLRGRRRRRRRSCCTRAGVDHSLAEVRARADEIADPSGRRPASTPGHRSGVMLPNADVVPALFAVWRAGGVYVPLNPRLGCVRPRRTSSSRWSRPSIVTVARAPRPLRRPAGGRASVTGDAPARARRGPAVRSRTSPWSSSPRAPPAARSRCSSSTRACAPCSTT